MVGHGRGFYTGEALSLATQDIWISQWGGDFLLLAGDGYISEVASTVRADSSMFV